MVTTHYDSLIMPAMRGIITVLNTPFTSEDGIDWEGLRANVVNAIDAGVVGMLVPAMASEASCLTKAEKIALVRVVAAESSGRVSVIGGVSAATTEERIDLAETFLALGCNGILLPIDAATEPATTEAELQALANLNPEFLMLQDWDASGSGVPLETILQWFRRIDRFTWLKIEVADSGPKYSRILRATDGRLRVAGGWAVTQMIDGLDRGVDAFMPTGMHVIYTQIYRDYTGGNRRAAEARFRSIEPVLRFSNQSLETSIRFFKRLLHAQGVYQTPRIRIPGQEWTPAQARTADRLIRRVIQIENELTGGRI